MDAYYSGMIRNEKSKFDGHWWPIGNLERKRFGRLKIRKKYIPTLTVDSWNDRPSPFRRDPPCVIHGESESQVPFTLFDCEDWGTGIQNTRVGRTTYCPRMILWGDQIADQDQPLFNRVVLTAPEILKLLSSDHGRIFSSEDGSGIQYNIPKPRTLVDGIDCGQFGTLEIKEHWDLREGDRRLKAKATGVLEFSLASPISLRQANELIERASTAMHFVLATPVKFQITELWRVEAKLPCGLFSLSHNEGEDEREYLLRPLRISANRNEVMNAVSKCMQLSDDLLSPLRLLLSAIHGSASPLDYRFFDAARSFERAHGIVSKGRLVEKGVHKKTVEYLSEKIPPDLPISYKERLESSLEFANGPVFKSRLREFLCRPYAREFFPNDKQMDVFMDRVKNSRNAIAHFTAAKDNEERADFEDMRLMFRLADLMFSEILGCRTAELRDRYGAVYVSRRYFPLPG